MGPRKVGGIDDFYRLDADDIDESKTPPLVIEVLFGELDKLASTWIDQLLAFEPGPITNDELKFDIALVVGAQMMRGESFRQEQLGLLEYAAQQDPIEHSKDAARIWLGMTGKPIDDETVATTAAQMREKDRQSLLAR